MAEHVHSGSMDSSMLNNSDVASVSEMAQEGKDLPNMTSSAATLDMKDLSQEDASSIPLLIKKLVYKERPTTDVQTNTTLFTQTSDATATSDSSILSTESNRYSEISRTWINNLMGTMTSTRDFESETTSSPQSSHQDVSISKAAVEPTSSRSLSVQDETYKQNLFEQTTMSLSEQTGHIEQSTFQELTTSDMDTNSELVQQSTDLSNDIRLTSVYEDISDKITKTTFDSERFRTTRFSVTAETNPLKTEQTFTGKDRSEVTTNVSSFFENLFNAETDPTSLSNVSFSISSNTTVPTVTLCDYTNHSSNATDVEFLYPPIYDVIVEEYDDSTAVMVAKVTTLAMLAVAGVLGNAMVIWSVVRQRHLHRPPFYYLLSLSLTDLSRAAFCLPLVLMTLMQGSVWRHGNSACDLFAFANAFFVLSSGVSLLDIAADRHLSLIYSRSYRRRSGGALNLVVVLLGWSLAFLVAFPPVVGVGSYAFEESEGQCTLRHKFFRNNNDTLGFLMVFTALMLVTLFLYYRIFLALRANRRMRPLEHEPARSATWTFVGPGANGQAFVNWVNGFGGTHLGNLPNLVRNPPRPNIARVVNLHVARNQHVTRLFFLMTLSFNALWLPYQVLSYWRVFGGAEDIEGGFVTAAAWFSYGQVVVCPVVYFSSRGAARPRPSRADLSPQDKQEYLLESVNRKK